MSGEVTDEELEAATLAAEEDARRARSALERVTASNARIARALNASRGSEATEPSPFDMGVVLSLASKQTGMTVDELQAAANATDLDMAALPERDPREIARARAQRAGVPELHIRHLIDKDPETSQAFTAVRDFMANVSLGFLVLSGGKGVHKTGSACWALSQAEGEYVEAADLLAIAIEDKARYLRLRKSALVVLDELGTEAADDKGYWQRTFNTLWNGWYAGCAKVIVTCNLKVEQFHKMYGERVMDRLRERGRFIIIGGESLRKKA